MEGYKEHTSEKYEPKNQKTKVCNHCICNVLSKLVEEQKDEGEQGYKPCSIDEPKRKKARATIPFLLQTPHGNPFYTWGNVGKKDCFATVFFTVLKVDCKKNCAVLELLKPNQSLIDQEANCVEPALICDVDFVMPTKERVVIDLSCYSALKLISPELIKTHSYGNVHR